MEAVGTAAAFAELLSLSFEVSKAAKSLVRSFLHAPEELTQLTAILDLIHARITQLHSFSEDLSASESATLLPPEHQTMLLTGLRTHHRTLRMIQSICNTRSGKSETLATRLRWAMLDKRKANRVLGKVSKDESQLSITLDILNARLNLLNQSSLNTNHALLYAKVEESTDAIKTWVHVEIQKLAESGSQCTASRLEAVEIVSDKDRESFAEVLTRQKPKAVKIKTSDSSLNKRDHVFNQRVTERPRRCPKPPLHTFIVGQVDPGTRLDEHDMRKSLSYYSAAMGRLHPFPAAGNFTTAASVVLQSKRRYRKLRLILDVGFNLLHQQIWQFDLSVKITRQYGSMPKLNCSITIYNLRPSDAPIFKACQEHDVQTVRYLLESGQASINDVDEVIGGLLEHAVQGNYKQYWYTRDEHSIQRTLDHLLDQGCDPRFFYGPLTEDRLPAILFAFDRGYSVAVSSLISRKADILSYGSTLAGYFQAMNGKFGWKVNLARAIGYPDWHIELPVANLSFDTILHGASEDSNVSELLFALEVAGLDPDVKNIHGRTALHNAALQDFLKGAVILVESGAEVDCSAASSKGTPLIRSINLMTRASEVAPYLLLQGANPRLKTGQGVSAWHQLWKGTCLPTSRYGKSKAWSFSRFEGELAHLLLHGVDPFELFAAPDSAWDLISLSPWRWTSRSLLRATEIARSWSYDVMRALGDEMPHEERIARFEAADETRTPTFISHWSHSGMISKALPKATSQSPNSTTAEDCATSADNSYNAQTASTAHCGNNDENDNDVDEIDDDDDADDNGKNTFFRAQSQFHTHISTSQGRHLLSRFPMVLALCSALQFAGYRAEMDEDGDIWYDDEDGDRYVDARETQPDGDDFAPDFCPICQDFEGHGLGHILETVEEAKREMREYREKVKAAKRRF